MMKFTMLFRFSVSSGSGRVPWPTSNFTKRYVRALLTNIVWKPETSIKLRELSPLLLALRMKEAA